MSVCTGYIHVLRIPHAHIARMWSGFSSLMRSFCLFNVVALANGICLCRIDIKTQLGPELAVVRPVIIERSAKRLLDNTPVALTVCLRA